MGTELKILDNGSAMSLERRLRCAACGNEFTCCASLDACWCAEIPLNDLARAELRSDYSDCLCRDCLEKLQNRSGKPTVAPEVM